MEEFINIFIHLEQEKTIHLLLTIIADIQLYENWKTRQHNM